MYQEVRSLLMLGVNCDLIHSLICNEKMKMWIRVKGNMFVDKTTVGSNGKQNDFQLPT